MISGREGLSLILGFTFGTYIAASVTSLSSQRKNNNLEIYYSSNCLPIIKLHREMARDEIYIQSHSNKNTFISLAL